MADQHLKDAKEAEDKMRSAVSDDEDPNVEPHGLDWL
jgi:hypothetical protein